jgi:hypothetical protein
MQNSSGLSPYKVRFFNEMFYTLYKKKLEDKLNDQAQLQNDVLIEVATEGQEKRVVAQGNVVASSITLTANEVCDYYNLKNPHAPINSENLRKKYLNELITAGYIEALDVRDGNTKKVYYPIIVPSEGEATLQSITEETREYGINPEFFIHQKINVTIDYIPLSKTG